ncbi:MAG: NAD(P)-dependent glycerol-3-phosphate dehydrogenase [Burkholderiales bacterium]|nr:NAD(P)-dependent glycerol-3-phosphate dehydrogenase [Burkholderiales bacterium]
MAISILGAGSWGSALAIAMSHIDSVLLWSKSQQQVEQINLTKSNMHYLPAEIYFGANVVATNNLADCFSSDLIIIATPINSLREIITMIKDQCNNSIPDLIWVCKGFETNSALLPSQIVKSILDNQNFGAMLGPSFAQEVALNLPTAVTLASSNSHLLQKWLDKLNSIPNFRVYANNDLIGAEVGAGVKNIIAIATGISDGMKFGLNARAAVITRSLTEINQLIISMGGNVDTILGLSGIGDLILTCTGDLSRNRSFGLQLAQGRQVKDILESLGHVVEGVNALPEVYRLSKKYNIQMIIVETLYKIIYENMPIQNLVDSLFKRQPKYEFN